MADGYEIERKFLVTAPPTTDGGPALRIAQAYLFSDARTVLRIGRRHGGWRLTVKDAGPGPARREFHTMLPEELGAALFTSPTARHTVKYRRRIDHRGRTWFVDAYQDAHAGLVLAETELRDLDEHVDLPPWCGTEVTARVEYHDHALARSAPAGPATDRPRTRRRNTVPTTATEERSFLLFKPDAVERDLVESGARAVRETGLRTVRRYRTELTEHQLAGLYAQIDPDDRPLTAGMLRRCLTKRPVEVLEAVGEQACSRLLAVKTALRAEHGNVIYGNLVHCPDTPDEAAAQFEALADRTGQSFRPVRRHWQGWPLPVIEDALDHWWAEARDAGHRTPTHWAPSHSGHAFVLRIAVPRRWVIEFDRIVRFLADLADTDDPGYGLRAALAALYDEQGLPMPARTAAEAHRLALRVREFGLTAELPPTKAPQGERT
ncbi:nucleoside-diphosphate kinase [Kitasatospora fiedleri]|uniref:nucleoside-diphosphate kinase n=1 Tax=Kitasatospora fiedleri TaxID=2991545 RepID=UPI00249BAEE1|nr:nucleoside-diphosphate kinase [Kitasatospora fiedleri]